MSNEALSMCLMEAKGSESYFSEENVNITEMNEKTENGIVLSAFNAG